MLDKATIEILRQALDGLSTPAATGLWPAIRPLDQLGSAGMNVVIDFGATSALGAPVIFATRPAAASDLLAPLSPRRRSVAELVLRGASNKEISRALDISLGTVKDHVHDILTTLGYRSRTEFISAALQGG